MKWICVAAYRDGESERVTERLIQKSSKKWGNYANYDTGTAARK
jgi:hypothetical protein